MQYLPFPLQFGGWSFFVVNLVLGLGFGIALDRSGFGNSKRIAGQFLLTDMTVLKVMFSAVVTAMLLLLWSNGLGLIDLSSIYINETYLWPAAIGGLLIGIGMVVGGYCPGTSLVAMSSLKIDGFFFIGGLFFGIFLFGQSVPSYWDFFQQSGYLGRFTLDEWLGTSLGMTAVLVTLMALAAFWAAETLGESGQPKTKRPWHPFGGVKRTGATLAILASLGLLVLPQPTLETRLDRAETDLQQVLDAREVQIDPAELLGLMHNNQVRLVLVDLRAEVDFNLFHLLDAKRVGVADLRSGWTNTLPAEALVILMGNDEELAAEAWKILQVQKVTSSYILAGGINGWLDVYGPYSEVKLERFASADRPTSRGVFAYDFPAALGDRIDIAWPDAKHMKLPDRPYEKKAKAAKKAVSAGGGCG